VRNSICTEATNSGVEEAAERTMASVASIVANSRPKMLEDAAVLSMLAVEADRTTTNSTDTAKGEG
jgi:hypothetical protein